MSIASNKIDSSSFIDIPLAANVAGQFTDLFSIKPTAKYASGARTVLRINDEIFGFAMSISWNIETTVTEIRTIDDYLPVELAPKHIIVTGTIGGLMIPGSGPSRNDIQANIINFLQQKYMTIEVKDSQTDNLLFFTTKAMVVSRAESLSSEQLGGVTLNWRAMGWKDDKEVDRYKVVYEEDAYLKPSSAEYDGVDLTL